MTIADFQISDTVPSLTDALNTAVSGSAMRVAKSRSIQFGRKSGPVGLYTFMFRSLRDLVYVYCIIAAVIESQVGSKSELIGSKPSATVPINSDLLPTLTLDCESQKVKGRGLRQKQFSLCSKHMIYLHCHYERSNCSVHHLHEHTL